MRVISRFHDYYDGVQRLGQDRSVVYVREQRNLGDAEAAGYECPLPIHIDAVRSRTSILYFAPFWVAVAGKRFRGMRVREVSEAVVPPFITESHFYSLEACREHVIQASLTDPFKEEDRRSRRYRWWRKTGVSLAEWFAAQGTTELRDLMSKRGHVCVADSGRTTDRKPDPFVLDPRLTDYDFFRVYDPFTIFQELSMWVGGVLPGRDAMCAEVSDADRFIEHGFDAVTSFRGRNR